jgi:SNF2 family DNA or RNA helicase
MNDLVPTSLATKMAERKAVAKEWAPWEYQERGLKFMLEDAQCGLLLNPGMGKTAVTLAALVVLLRKKFVKRALIVAPLRPVYEVWPFEVSDWKDFHKLGVAILHGGNKDKILRALQPEHQVVLINYEGLAWLFDSKERIRLLDADMLVCDESSKVKNSQSLRFKVLRRVIQLFKRRYILTGSPRPRNYEDLWGQIYVLDRGVALGSYITHFRNLWFYPTGYQMREWALLPGADKQINKLVAPMVLRLDAKDYLKLPGTPERFHRVELPEKVRSEYDSIEEQMMSTLFDAPMVSAGAARSKLCQMANGAVYLDTSVVDERWPSKVRPVKTLHSAKVNALVDLYEELQGEPLLVGIGYHHDVVAIRNVLGKDTPCLNSAVTRSQGASIIEAWNKGELPLLLGHPASMGHGLNLQKCGCRNVAYFDIPDDYDLYDQFFCRVWRQGNKADFVMRHLFIATNTVDEAKMRNLVRKGDGQRDFLQAMKEYAEKKYGRRITR